MKIHIIAVGKLKEKFLVRGIAEYRRAPEGIRQGVDRRDS